MKIADAIRQTPMRQSIIAFLDNHPNEVFTNRELRAIFHSDRSVFSHLPRPYQHAQGQHYATFYGCPKALAKLALVLKKAGRS